MDSVRKVLGKIDLDPASSELANTNVRAARIFTREQDGLSQSWSGVVYMNPPYRTQQYPFIRKLLDHYADGDVSEAIALVPFTDGKDAQRFFAACDAICFTQRRVSFWSPEGDKGGPGRNPSVFAYMGPNADRFAAEFSQWGIVSTKNQSQGG